MDRMDRLDRIDRIDRIDRTDRIDRIEDILTLEHESLSPKKYCSQSKKQRCQPGRCVHYSPGGRYEIYLA